ncbi:hypothetical protein SCUCBS95973_006719 [Sporothrix curviconia]|uniref:JmjC domain-containing protein n=1 Tax=Sporothrix curviconia TaxID=1260050 RepID=A0ABP0C9L2_9PEZI
MADLRRGLWEHCLAAARQIAHDHATTAAGLKGCGAPLIDLLRRQAAQILLLQEDDRDSKDVRLVARRLDDLVELAHARFYAFRPSDVPACWRQLYTDASILLFSLRWWQRRANRAPLSDDDLDGLVRPLDMALILAGGAGPPRRGRDWIHATLETLHRVLQDEEPDAVDDDNDGDDDEARPRKKPRREPDIVKRHAGVFPIPDFSAGPFFNEGDSSSSSCSPSSSSKCQFVPPIRHPVPRSGPLGMEAFQAYLDYGGAGFAAAAAANCKPLVLSGMLDLWPARQKTARPWSSPAYLRWRTLRGRRLVPVEVGRSYVDDGWTQSIVPFATVLEELESASEDPTRKKKTGPMYLAQHALFTQMPMLQQDISIPDACYTTTTMDSDSDDDDNVIDGHVLTNAWLGPPGTITPLHTDPHHNLLAQVVGRKYVRLYAPEQTEALRPRGREAGGVDMGNTSTVDVGVMEGWDKAEGGEGDEGEGVGSAEAAAFRAVPYVDCILEPGDTLYIPQGWWHYVRGLSVSFSVSFWWN